MQDITYTIYSPKIPTYVKENCRIFPNRKGGILYYWITPRVIKGVCHADDLGYLFKHLLTPVIKPGSLDDISVRRFVKLWTNFAKYGNPTPDKKDLGIKWEQVKETAINFLDIGKELTLNVNPEPERMALWREIYQLNPETAHYL